MTDAAETATAPTKAAAAGPARPASRLPGLILLLLILGLIAWHLIGDRQTPYTSQARVHAFVVGIASEVPGRIEAVHVRNNQLVRKGDKLFTLSADSFTIAVDKARADISATLREQQAQDAAIVAALAQRHIAETERDKARRDAERYERVYAEDNGAISVRRLDFARASAIEAEARLGAADAQVAQARAARGPQGDANDRLVAARSALAKAQLDLGKTVVVAPGDGLITDLRADRGQFAAAGSPVMTFIAVHDGWVTADMTENNLGLVTIGAPAEIVLDSRPGQIFKGHVRSIGRGVASGSRPQPGALPDVQNNRDFLRQAQRFPVVIAFDRGQPDLLPALREGGQADVQVYAAPDGVVAALGRFWIWLCSLLAYAY